MTEISHNNIYFTGKVGTPKNGGREQNFSFTFDSYDDNHYELIAEIHSYCKRIFHDNFFGWGKITLVGDCLSFNFYMGQEKTRPTKDFEPEFNKLANGFFGLLNRYQVELTASMNCLTSEEYEIKFKQNTSNRRSHLHDLTKLKSAFELGLDNYIELDGAHLSSIFSPIIHDAAKGKARANSYLMTLEKCNNLEEVLLLLHAALSDTNSGSEIKAQIKKAFTTKKQHIPCTNEEFIFKIFAASINANNSHAPKSVKTFAQIEKHSSLIAKAANNITQPVFLMNHLDLDLDSDSEPSQQPSGTLALEK